MRDRDGRTYAAASVKLESFSIDALPLAVAMAISSGAKGLEAGVIVSTRADRPIVDLSVIRDLAGEGVPVFMADAAGVVTSVQQS